MDRLNLHLLLDDVLGNVCHQVSLTGIAIRKEFDHEVPEISADGDQLRQVFTNLVVNAVEAMPGGGILTITTRYDPESTTCVVTVVDTGVGMAPELLQKIFNPFFTTKGTGTGLGLAVIYGIVRGHGGSIEVASSPGAGAIFTVSLPYRVEAPTSAPGFRR